MEEVLVGIHVTMEASITTLCSDETSETIGISLTFIVDIYIFAKLDVDRIPEKSSVNDEDKVTKADAYLIKQTGILQEKYNSWSAYLEECKKENSTNIARNWDDVGNIIKPIVLMGSKIRDEIDNLLLDTDNKYRSEYRDLENAELDKKFLLFEANCIQIEKDLSITFGIEQWSLYQTFNPCETVVERYSDIKKHVIKSKELELVIKREEISDRISSLTKEITKIKMDRNEAMFSIPELKNSIKEINEEISRKNSLSPSQYLTNISDGESQFVNDLKAKKDQLVIALNNQIDLLKNDKKAKKFIDTISSIDEIIAKENSFINNIGKSKYILDLNSKTDNNGDANKLYGQIKATEIEIARCENVITKCNDNIAEMKKELGTLAHEYDELVKQWPQM